MKMAVLVAEEFVVSMEPASMSNARVEKVPCQRNTRAMSVWSRSAR